ncbi:MAG: OmpH family outer membrane protein [Alcanivorax sediminis]|uniref:OmpH family outer membrane protein n=1 Tax=Alcanivorax sediminis TaxID=2663008 RepID=A0A6N7M1P5_9GAMM|nr:OmpH family outer membrane protein [Alcanivorax sediminis]MQX54160.1 OmpH family outer membrane protein [Alcanivorax sediminis]
MMKKCLLAAALLFPALALAESNIGIVYPLKALQETTAVKGKMSALEKELAPDEEKLNKLGMEVQELQAKMQKEAMTLSPDQQEEMSTRGKQKMLEIQSLQRKLQGRAEAAQREVMEDMGPKFQQAIEQVAKDKKLDLVINAQAAVYVGENAVDVTEAVSQQLNKMK